MSQLNRAQQTFLFQYLSLILIVLSLLIVASSRFKVTTPKVEPQTLVPTPDQRVLVSELNLPNVFSEDKESINSESLEPLRELILNHNIDVHFVISTRSGLAAKVSRLSHVLREQSFWKDSFTVSGKINLDSAQTELKAHFEWNQL
jgi:hypothetical protein